MPGGQGTQPPFPPTVGHIAGPVTVSSEASFGFDVSAALLLKTEGFLVFILFHCCVVDSIPLSREAASPLPAQVLRVRAAF